MWDEPRLRTPEQFERWSHIVAIVHNHLVLARDLVEPELRPWENTQRQPTPRTLCDAGSANCCHVWGPLPDHHNHAGNRMAGAKGQS